MTDKHTPIKHFSESELCELEASCDLPDESTFNIPVSVGTMKAFIAAIRVHQSPLTKHASDCAVHNAPAFEPGECDCGAVNRDHLFDELVKVLSDVFKAFLCPHDGDLTHPELCEKAKVVLQKVRAAQ